MQSFSDFCYDTAFLKLHHEMTKIVSLEAKIQYNTR